MKPAGPVTQPSRPSGSCLVDRACGSPRRWRRTSPDESIGTKICAASPSSDDDRRRDALRARRRCRRCRRRASGCSASSSSVSAPSPVTTTTAGMRVAAEEVGQPLAHLRRVGALRQERRLVVRRDLVDLAEVRSADGSADEPDEDEDDRDADPQPAGGLAVGVGEAAGISLAYLAISRIAAHSVSWSAMLSAALALVGALVYGAADFLGGLAAQAPALDRRHGGRPRHPGWCCSRSLLPLRRRRVGAGRRRVGRRWRASFGVDRDRAAVRLPRDRADEHPLAAHGRGLGDRADAVGARSSNGETLSPIGYAGLGGRARRRRAGRLHPRREGRAARARGGSSWPSARASRSARSSSSIDQTSAESGLVPLVMTRATNIAITAVIVGALVISALSARPPRGERAGRRRVSRSGRPRAATQIWSTRRASSGAGVPASRNRAWLLAIICGVAGCRGERDHAAGAADRRSVDRLGPDRALPGRNDPPRGDRAAGTRRRRAVGRASPSR